MNSNLSITSFLIAFFCFYFNSNAQTVEELKKQKMAEKQEKLRKAKAETTKTAVVVGYHGGTLAPLGIALYTSTPKNINFYASLRGGENMSTQELAEKGLVLNVGITKNLFYPVAFYLAGGISDYTTRTRIDANSQYVSPYGTQKYEAEWEFGADTSTGLIIHVKRVKFQGGVSLFNFGRPEFCFGIGWNLLNLN